MQGLPVWLLVLLGLAGLTGLAGMAMTVAGMNRPPAQRRRYFTIGLALSVAGGAAFLVMLGTV
jgi:bacteriorhodopsin